MIKADLNINDALKYLVNKLSEIYEFNEAKSISLYYLEHLTGFSKMQIYEKRNQIISNYDRKKLIEDCSKLMQFYPVQYLTNKAWFYNNLFYICEEVLIPRQETEELVKIIIDNNKEKVNKILDIGSGSGNIAISLKLQMPQAEVFACDNSEKAIEVIKKNCDIHNCKINVIYEDIFNYNLLKLHSPYSIIVSNPPYVRMSEKKMMQNNVLVYEPESALFVNDENALIYYEQIANAGISLLINGGQLYFEINENLHQETLNMLKTIGYSNCKAIKDINDKWRIVTAIKK